MSSSHAKHIHQKGFTLVELLVTLAVLSILMTVGIPGFQNFIESNRLTGVTNDLVGALNYARSEAVKRGVPVVLCKTANGTSCATSGNWEGGWLVAVNADNDMPPVISSTDVLKVWDAAPSGYTVGSSGLSDYVVFDHFGATSNTGTFAICHDSKTAGARAISITRLYPKLAKDTDANSIPNKDDGTDIASCGAP